MEGTYLSEVAPRTIELGPVPFSLYSPDNSGRMILFCNAGFEITDNHLESLMNARRPFFIQRSDMDSYLDYTSERLEAIIANPGIRLNDKTNILHKTGKRTVQKLWEQPRSGKCMKQSSKVVEQYVNLLIQAPEAASNLFALSALDSYTFSHSINVATFNLLIGSIIYHNRKDLLWDLGMTGLLHDIGKTMVDQEVLMKPGRLDPDELQLMRRHAEFSYDIARSHAMDESILDGIGGHHERMNGTGYPRQYRGEQIHLFARITAVSDIYDALTSERVYKEAKHHVEALKEMSRDPRALDATVFTALLEVVFKNETLINRFISTNLRHWHLDPVEAGNRTVNFDLADRLDELSTPEM